MKPDKKDKIIADLSMRIVFLSLTIVLMLVIAIIYYFWTPTPTENYDSFCGNVFVEEQNEEKMRAKYGNDFNFDTGEKLFKQNCAVCHSLGKNELTGPGLQGLTNRAPSEEWLFYYLSNPDSLIRLKDPYILKLHRDYKNNGNEDPHMDLTLTDKEVKEILAYITLPISLY